MKDFLLALLFLFAPSAFSLAEQLSTPEAIHSSFKFLESEEDTVNLEKLSALVLDKYYTETKLLDRVFAFYVSQKDRKKVFDIVYMVSVKNSCSRSSQTKNTSAACQHLRSLWLDGLWQLPFYDTTSVIIDEAKENIRGALCDKAISTLEELEKREGPLLQLLETLEEAYRCLKSPARVRYTPSRIESLRVFDL